MQAPHALGAMTLSPNLVQKFVNIPYIQEYKDLKGHLGRPLLTLRFWIKADGSGPCITNVTFPSDPSLIIVFPCQ